jgi:uncharacterized RDD family membrane protein YckC
MTTRQRTLLIQTPEGIIFPLILASPISRFLALAIDIIVTYLISMAMAYVLTAMSLIHGDIAGMFWIISEFALSIGYPIFFEWAWRGQTIGKRVMRIQVMDEQGLRLQFHQIVIRNLLRSVDFIPGFYLIGGIACLVSARGQRLGDMAAGTIVVHHPRIPEPDLDQVLPGKYNSFRNYPHLAARLRQNTSPLEAGIALSALVRRNEFDADARLIVFAEIRARLEHHSSFPAEITEGISDEQYVRNAVEILFRQ